ncbi:glycosyltransferase [Agrobacterium rosae]|uniref:Glycosyltransferase n=1 Tax=Agrobacterium rosae TaxID=1972867 RepID=A0AAW9FQH7_9HYPH|nr:glycosyltransferase [Agrobacterium rosae]MDX8305842.1 glycosyltransferase [Agrobacterium rosae]
MRLGSIPTLFRNSIGAKRYAKIFDKKYYYQAYPDVKNAGLNAWTHYRTTGWKEGRNPHQKFNTLAYIACNPDILELDISPVEHVIDYHTINFSGAYAGYAEQKSNLSLLNHPRVPATLHQYIARFEAIRSCNLFDQDFYASQLASPPNDLIEHYIRHGHLSLIAPHPNFDPVFYYERYSDVRRAAANPLVHYLQHGEREGRQCIIAVDNGNERANTVGGNLLDHNYWSACADITDRLRHAPASHEAVSGPLISILTPVYNVEVSLLREMIDSVLRQTYANWELCLVDDGSTALGLHEMLNGLTVEDARIKVAFRRENGGISAATNDCLAMAEGEYIALVDNDDLLTVDALAEMAKAIVINKYPDWLYSDECKIDSENRISDLFAKPDWSPLMLTNYMYTGHLTLYRKAAVTRLGGFRTKFDFSQDYDLALRMAEITNSIVHVAKYLYCWRLIPSSGSMGGKPSARISNLGALGDAAARRGWEGEAIALPTANRLKFSVKDDLVSIIIPSDNESNIRKSLDSILTSSTYKNIEVIVVTNSAIAKSLGGLYRQNNVVWSRYDLTFNFSDKCNSGAKVASGKYLIFFNDDVRVITPDWIEVVMELFSVSRVGIVGPKLLYEDGSIQHAGMVTGVRRFVGTAFHSYESDTTAHFNFAQCVREVSLVCGALLAISREIFDLVGGFDAINTPVNHSDVDLCFKVREAGYFCVYTPYASLFHIGHVSLGEEDKRIAEGKRPKKKEKIDTYLISRWGDFIARDPYFPPAIRDLVYLDSQEPFSFFPPTLQRETVRDVLILSHDLSGSGAPKVAYDLAAMFRRSECNVVVISPTDGYYREKLSEEGFAVIIDPLITSAHPASMAVLQGFDLVIANTIVTWQAAQDLSKNTDVILYAHETELVRHLAAQEIEFVPALRNLKAIWCGSEKSANYLRDFGLEPKIIEYGVDDLSKSPSIKRISVGMLGSYEARKAQDLAVLGFASIEEDVREMAKLDIFGRVLDQAYFDEVNRLAAPYANIFLHGELDYKMYLEQLTDLDIVIVCSRDDTLPLVSLDALALGKPLICSRTTGTSAYIINLESGMILDDNTPQEIGEVLRQVIKDKTLREELGLGARKVFEENFTKTSFSKRLSAELNFTVRS